MRAGLKKRKKCAGIARMTVLVILMLAGSLIWVRPALGAVPLVIEVVAPHEMEKDVQEIQGKEKPRILL